MDSLKRKECIYTGYILLSAASVWLWSDICDCEIGDCRNLSNVLFVQLANFTTQPQKNAFGQDVYKNMQSYTTATGSFCSITPVRKWRCACTGTQPVEGYAGCQQNSCMHSVSSSRHSDYSCHNAFVRSSETVKTQKGILKNQHFLGLRLLFLASMSEVQQYNRPITRAIESPSKSATCNAE